MTTNTYWNDGETKPGRVDHVAEAQWLLEKALSDEVVSSTAAARAHDMFTARAQVYATLALVEQQRIANVITLGEHWQSTGYDFADSMTPVLRDDIQAALRLD